MWKAKRCIRIAAKDKATPDNQHTIATIVTANQLSGNDRKNPVGGTPNATSADKAAHDRIAMAAAHTLEVPIGCRIKPR
ncbi:MAG: hypothetical protein Aurels2KO_04770 [Aureliella sp.]